MKKLLVGTVIVALIAGILLYSFTTMKDPIQVQETIADHPIDDKKNFTQVKTTLQLIDRHDEDEYTMEWKTSSEINNKMYIAHDISLLFEDGRLKETISQTKENSHILTQTAKISGEDSGHFEAITFHYGQFHYPHDVTKSVQSMSYDQLYILDSPLSPIEFFKSPQTPSEEEGKRVLDTIINQNLQYTWEELIDYFHIKAENYYSVPLTNLYEYNNTSLPNLTIEDTKEMIALTWNCIYKYYFLGIEKHDGTVLSPIGSSIPLILYHNSYSHIIVVFTNKDGEKYSALKNTGRF